MDLRAEYAAMLKDVHGGRFAEAIATADRLIASADDSNDPQDELLVGGVMMMRLGLRARLEPGEAVVAECEALFARYRDATQPPASVIAAEALKTELELLVHDPTDRRIDTTAEHLESEFAKACGHPNQMAIARPLLSSIDLLCGRGHARQALGLARDLVVRLTSSENGEERQAAAAAQLWVVIAMTYGGERFTLDGNPPNLGELFRHTLNKTESEQDQAGAAFGAMNREMNACCALGQAGIDAADSLLAELNTRNGWLQAKIVTWMIKLSILDHLGRTSETNQAIRQLVALGAGAHLPGIDEAITELQTKLS